MPGWTRVEYDPEAGHIRLTKPMMTRNDIPSPELFEQQLDTLVEIANFNRQKIEVQFRSRCGESLVWRIAQRRRRHAVCRCAVRS